jgi:hypothetical protein
MLVYLRRTRTITNKNVLLNLWEITGIMSENRNSNQEESENAAWVANAGKKRG